MATTPIAMVGRELENMKILLCVPAGSNLKSIEEPASLTGLPGLEHRQGGYEARKLQRRGLDQSAE